jgi:hypothetical protein
LIAYVALVMAAILLGAVVLYRVSGWRGTLLGVALLSASAALGAWGYARRDEPPVQPCTFPTSPGELGAICGFRNPEDVEAVREHGALLISEEGLGGRILALRPGDPSAGPRVVWPSGKMKPSATGGDAACQPPDDPDAMSPHGLSVRESVSPKEPARVALVLHQFRDGVVTDALQFFDVVDGDPIELRWTGCVPFPDDAIGNDVAWLPDGSLVATNYAPRGTPADLSRAILRGALGFDTGDVLHWSKDRGWTHVPGTESAIPNGIAVAADGRTFYFADAGNRRVAVVPLALLDHASGTVAAAGIERIDVGGAPDNLSVTASGTVLATVATLAGDLPVLCGIGGRRCRGGWAVWEVDPAARSATEILADDGRRLATATSALEVGNLLYVGSMADDRLGVYRKP